jgi:hypothetical protein
MVPLLTTVLPGPSVEMPCELPPVVAMLPLLVMSVRVLLFDVTRMPAGAAAGGADGAVVGQRVVVARGDHRRARRARAARDGDLPLLVMLLASRTSSACVALVRAWRRGPR